VKEPKAKKEKSTKDKAAPKVAKAPTAKAAGQDFIASAQGIQVAVDDVEFKAEPKVFNQRCVLPCRLC
jgi:hypothetical protein